MALIVTAISITTSLPHTVRHVYVNTGRQYAECRHAMCRLVECRGADPEFLTDGLQLEFFRSVALIKLFTLVQGMLAEGKGSVQLNSSLR